MKRSVNTKKPKIKSENLDPVLTSEEHKLLDLLAQIVVKATLKEYAEIEAEKKRSSDRA